MSGMDPTAAIEALRTSTEAGFRDLRADLTSRLDQTVTRREHEAEVRRIDSEHKQLAARHDELAKSADTEHASIRELIAADKEARDVERARVEDARRADRRVYLQVTVAAVAVAATIVGIIVSIFAN